MKYEVIFRRLASWDLSQAADWYNAKRRGLGNQLFLAVEASIGLVA